MTNKERLVIWELFESFIKIPDIRNNCDTGALGTFRMDVVQIQSLVYKAAYQYLFGEKDEYGNQEFKDKFNDLKEFIEIRQSNNWDNT